jgi:hypothetical protein
MFEDEPEDKTRKVLYARVDIRHLAKVDPGNPGTWYPSNSLLKRVYCIPPFKSAILIKTFGAWHSTAMTPTWSEASKCSNTVKYHEVCRSVQNTPLFKSSTACGRREVMASARDSRLSFSRIYDCLQSVNTIIVCLRIDSNERTPEWVLEEEVK